MTNLSDNTDRVRIGHRLRQLRQDRNLTQAQLADLCEMKQTTISKIESGKFNASIDLLSRVIRPLGGELDIREG